MSFMSAFAPTTQFDRDRVSIEPVFTNRLLRLLKLASLWLTPLTSHCGGMMTLARSHSSETNFR